MFIKKAIISLTAKSVAIAISFGAGIIISRGLGPEMRGEFALIIVVSTVLVLIASLGLPESGVIRYSNAPQKHAAQFCWEVMISYFVLVSLFIFLATIKALFSLPVVSATVLWSALGLSVFEIFLIHLRHFYLGHHRYFEYNTLQVGNQTLFLLFLLIAANRWPISLESVIFSMLLANIFLLLYFAPSRFRLMVTSIKQKPDLKYFIVRLKESFGFFKIGLLGYLYQKILYFYIVYKIGNYGLGIYAISEVIPSIFMNLSTQVSILMFPVVAHEKIKSIALTVRVIRLQFASGLFFCFIAFFFGEILLALVYSSRYSEAHSAMRYLCIASGLSGVAGTIGNYLSANGSVNDVLKTNLIGLIVTAILCGSFASVLKPNVGIFGLTVLAGQLASFIYLLFKFKQSTGVGVRTLLLSDSEIQRI